MNSALAICLNPYKYNYYIESRHLVGIGRDLWVAAASALASITNGIVSSADGAWDGYCEYSGDELWSEYLNCQRKKDIEEYSRLNIQLCKCQ